MSADASAGEPPTATDAPASVAAASAPAKQDAADSGDDRQQLHGSHRALVLAALGVVYGDIGTSPLYAFHESVHHIHNPDAPHVLGILSLFFWSIVLVIAI